MAKEQQESEFKPPRPVIVIDIDNTVQQTSSWVAQQINKKFPETISQDILQLDNLKKSPAFANRPDIIDFIKTLQSDNSIITQPPAYPDAIESINQFANLGADIYFVTSRGYDQQSATEDWLQSHGLGQFIDKVIYRTEESRANETTAEYKLAQTIKLKANIVIDDLQDAIDNLSQFEQYNDSELIKVLAFLQPWNSDNYQNARFEQQKGNTLTNHLPNWSEISEIINRIIRIYPLFFEQNTPNSPVKQPNSF